MPVSSSELARLSVSESRCRRTMQLERGGVGLYGLVKLVGVHRESEAVSKRGGDVHDGGGVASRHAIRPQTMMSLEEEVRRLREQGDASLALKGAHITAQGTRDVLSAVIDDLDWGMSKKKYF